MRINIELSKLVKFLTFACIFVNNWKVTSDHTIELVQIVITNYSNWTILRGPVDQFPFVVGFRVWLYYMYVYMCSPLCD